MTQAIATPTPEAWKTPSRHAAWRWVHVGVAALAMVLTLYGHRIALYKFSRSASRLANTKERKLRLEYFVRVLQTCGSG